MDQQDQQIKEVEVEVLKPDIPDFNEQKIPKAILTAEVQSERDVRRYICKDGKFNKGFEHFFDVETGKFGSKSEILYRATMTKEQAQKFITDLCEKSGRTVVIDSLTGRPRAVPGWNLDIRVPGMSLAEQRSPTLPEGVLRERLNNQLLLEQTKQIDELKATVAKLAEPKPESAKEEPEPEKPGKKRQS
jgi:hypothetical protein